MRPHSVPRHGVLIEMKLQPQSVVMPGSTLHPGSANTSVAWIAGAETPDPGSKSGAGPIRGRNDSPQRGGAKTARDGGAARFAACIRAVREQSLTVLHDLRAHDVDMLTVGQYLQPRPGNLPVRRYVAPQVFEALARSARQLGFSHAACGPLVRSSYHADSQAQAAGI